MVEQRIHEPRTPALQAVYALARRMSAETQAELVASYLAGSTARDLAAQNGIAHTTSLGYSSVMT